MRLPGEGACKPSNSQGGSTQGSPILSEVLKHKVLEEALRQAREAYDTATAQRRAQLGSQAGFPNWVTSKADRYHWVIGHHSFAYAQSAEAQARYGYDLAKDIFGVQPPETEDIHFGDPVGATLSDPVTLPEHYTRYPIEPIYFIMENGLDFQTGCVVKYVLRAPFKNGLEDLKKARRYLDMMIAKAEGKEDYAR